MKKLKINLILSFINQAITIIIPFITTPFLTRVVGTDGIGKFSYANSISSYFILICLLGLENYGAREISKASSDDVLLNKTFLEIYCSQLISSSIAILAYIVYCLHSKDIMAKIFILSVVSSAIDINWYFNGIEKYDISLIRKLITKIIVLVLIFVVVKNENGIYAYAAILLGSNIVGNFFLWFRKKSVVTNIDINKVMFHLKKSIRLFLPVFFGIFYKNIGKIILKVVTNYTQLGFYDCIDRIAQIPNYLFIALSQIMIAKISKNINNKNGNTCFFDLANNLVSFISSSVIFGIIAVSDVFIPLYFGKEYESCVLLCKVVLPAYIISGYSSVISSQLLLPYEKDNEFIISYMCGSIICILINPFLIGKFGPIGLAISLIITEVIILLVMSLLCKTSINPKRFIIKNIKYYISGIMMIIIVRQIKGKGPKILLLKIIAGIITYLLFLYLMLIISKKRQKKKINCNNVNTEVS